MYHRAMAMDNRDWYIDLLRKKTGYVERSTFRAPAPAPVYRRKTRQVGLHPVWRVFLCAVLVLLVFLAIKALRR